MKISNYLAIYFRQTEVRDFVFKTIQYTSMKYNYNTKFTKIRFITLDGKKNMKPYGINNPSVELHNKKVSNNDMIH